LVQRDDDGLRNALVLDQAGDRHHYFFDDHQTSRRLK
jgi:hypothetical protein